MTVADLQRRMTSRELTEWMAVDRLAQRPPDDSAQAADPVAALRQDMDRRALSALSKMNKQRKG